MTDSALSVEPSTPGQWSDEDEARLQATDASLQDAVMTRGVKPMLNQVQPDSPLARGAKAVAGAIGYDEGGEVDDDNSSVQAIPIPTDVSDDRATPIPTDDTPMQAIPVSDNDTSTDDQSVSNGPPEQTAGGQGNGARDLVSGKGAADHNELMGLVDAAKRAGAANDSEAVIQAIGTAPEEQRAPLLQAARNMAGAGLAHAAAASNAGDLARSGQFAGAAMPFIPNGDDVQFHHDKNGMTVSVSGLDGSDKQTTTLNPHDWHNYITGPQSKFDAIMGDGTQLPQPSTEQLGQQPKNLDTPSAQQPNIGAATGGGAGFGTGAQEQPSKQMSQKERAKRARDAIIHSDEENRTRELENLAEAGRRGEMSPTLSPTPEQRAYRAAHPVDQAGQPAATQQRAISPYDTPSAQQTPAAQQQPAAAQQAPAAQQRPASTSTLGINATAARTPADAAKRGQQTFGGGQTPAAPTVAGQEQQTFGGAKKPPPTSFSTNDQPSFAPATPRQSTPLDRIQTPGTPENEQRQISRLRASVNPDGTPNKAAQGEARQREIILNWEADRAGKPRPYSGWKNNGEWAPAGAIGARARANLPPSAQYPGGTNANGEANEWDAFQANVAAGKPREGDAEDIRRTNEEMDFQKYQRDPNSLGDRGVSSGLENHGGTPTYPSYMGGGRRGGGGGGGQRSGGSHRGGHRGGRRSDIEAPVQTAQADQAPAPETNDSPPTVATPQHALRLAKHIPYFLTPDGILKKNPNFQVG